MKTEEVRFEDEDLGLDVRLVVSQATVLMGMKRSRIKREGLNAKEEDLDRHLLRVYTFPDLIAATVEIEGLDLDFEVFLALPDTLVALWEEAVYRLNSHWLPAPETDEESTDPNPSTSSTDG